MLQDEGNFFLFETPLYNQLYFLNFVIGISNKPFLVKILIGLKYFKYINNKINY